MYMYGILFFLKKEKEKREIDIVNFMNKSGFLGLFIVLFHVHFAYKFHGCFTLFCKIWMENMYMNIKMGIYINSWPLKIRQTKKAF